MKTILAITSLLLFMSISHLKADEFKNTVEARIVSDVSSVKPGETFSVGVLLSIQPEWHIYWKNPGDSGLPTTFTLNLPEGFETGSLKWPAPEKFISNSFSQNYGYKDTVLLWRQIKAPSTLSRIKPLTIEGKATWVSCREICIPGEAGLTLKLNSIYAFTGNEKAVFESWSNKIPQESNKIDEYLEYTEKINNEKRSNFHKITIDWKEKVKDIEFFPNPEGSYFIENVNISHDSIENKSEITFSSKNYKGRITDNDKMETVLVITDDKGKQYSLVFPVKM